MRQTWPGLLCTACVMLGLVRCSSFSEEDMPESADAGDAGPAEAAVTDSSLDAVFEASFCEGIQTGDASKAFCADFDRGLLAAWRGPSLEQLWQYGGDDAGLALAPSPFSPPNALSAASDSGATGEIFYRVGAANFFRIELDVAMTQHAGETDEAMFTRLMLDGNVGIALYVSPTSGRVVFSEGDPSGSDYYDFLAGSPPLAGNPRHLVIELAPDTVSGTPSTHLTVRVDSVLVADVEDTRLTPSWPSSLELHVGLLDYVTPPFGFLLDDIQVGTTP